MFEKLPLGLEQYIYTLVPDEVIIWLPLVTIVLALLLWRYRYHVLLCGYCLLLLCQTVIFRYMTEVYKYRILPFQKLQHLIRGDAEICWEVALNISMFVPIGMLLTLCCDVAKWKIVVLIGALMSLVIEFLQLILKRGLCETDDVIVNTIGCALGYGIVKGIIGVVSLAKKINGI